MIHRIYSSLPAFKTLVFRPGLNVLLAQKSPGATQKQTRNRAGKTSLIEIVHLLCGANIDKQSPFRTKALADATFGMDFDLGGARVQAERSGKPRLKITVAGAGFLKGRGSLSNDEWRSVLGEKLFALSDAGADAARSPTFRSLFAYFVRRQLGNGFLAPEKQSGMQQLGDMQMALMFLMGLDWQIARDWQIVRDRERNLNELRKAVGAGAFGNLIGKAADLRTELTIAESRLGELRGHVSQFRVLPEYHELETEASALTRKLNDLANANTLDKSLLADIEAALSSESPPASDDVEKLYASAGVILPGTVKKRYEDVRSFHESVIRNRRDYLSGELDNARGRIEERNRQKIRLDHRRAQVMTILNSHGALDQFAKLQGELGRQEADVEALRLRFEAAEQLEGTRNELEIERNRLALRLRRDFSEQKHRLSEAILAFEETSNRLYESAGSLRIEDTANGPTFQFPMQGFRSKGIKNIQVFCFDMMLMRLCAKRGIGPGFLIHDSHLFDGVDGRQVIRALRIGAETAQELSFQYIVTMNEDDAFKEREDGFELNDHVLPVRLTDATENGGLFGIRFD